jgi:hypothetical protein
LLSFNGGNGCFLLSTPHGYIILLSLTFASLLFLPILVYLQPSFSIAFHIY